MEHRMSHSVSPIDLTANLSDNTLLASVLTAFSTLLESLPSESSSRTAPQLNDLFDNIELACIHFGAWCITELNVARALLPCLNHYPPLDLEDTRNLGGDRLRECLDMVYARLPCKGPEHQIPTKLTDGKRFYCPFCFAKTKRFSDMRSHLRNKRKHNVDNQTLQRLFPAGRPSKYLRCFGGFSESEAKRNGFKKKKTSTARTEATISTSHETAEDIELQQHELPREEIDTSISNPSAGMTFIGDQFTADLSNHLPQWFTQNSN